MSYGDLKVISMVIRVDQQRMHVFFVNWAAVTKTAFFQERIARQISEVVTPNIEGVNFNNMLTVPVVSFF